MNTETLPIEEHNRKMKDMRSLWEVTADRADRLQAENTSLIMENGTLSKVIGEIQNALSKLNPKPINHEHTACKCTTVRDGLDRSRTKKRNIHSVIEPQG